MKASIDRLREAAEALKQAQTAADVRAVFQKYYGELGWKRLCRMFVLGRRPEDVLGEEREG